MFKGPEAQASVPGHGKVWASRPVGQPLPSAHPFLCCQNLSLTTQGWGLPSPLCPCTRVGILRTFMPSHLCAYLYSGCCLCTQAQTQFGNVGTCWEGTNVVCEGFTCA